jgi:hypothetical protein
MAVVETVSLILLGQAHDVSAEELEPTTSPQTGRALRRVQVSFRVAAEQSDEMSDARRAATSPNLGPARVRRTVREHSTARSSRLSAR